MRHTLQELVKFQEEEEKKRKEERINREFRRLMRQEEKEINEMLWWESESRFG